MSLSVGVSIYFCFGFWGLESSSDSLLSSTGFSIWSVSNTIKITIVVHSKVTYKIFSNLQESNSGTRVWLSSLNT